MIKFIRKITATLTIGFLLPMSVLAATAADTTNVSPPELQISFPGLQFSPLIKEKDGSYLVPWIGDWVSGFYRYAVYAMTVIAAFMLTLAGFQYATSAGEPKKVAGAKKRATDAILALFLVYSSFIILYAINPSTVNLKGLSILGVKDLTVPFQDEIQQEVATTVSTNGDIKGSAKPCLVNFNNSSVPLTQVLTGVAGNRDQFLAEVNPKYKNVPIVKELIAKVGDAARDYAQDPLGMLTILAMESGFQSQDGKRGPCGEVGMTQLMPFNAEKFANISGCCVKIWRKSGGTTSECGGKMSASSSDLKACASKCGTCAEATDSCANSFNGAKGLDQSINATAGLMRADGKVPAVQNDLALIFMAYNGGPKLRSEASAVYARKAVQIYNNLCREFGGQN